MEDDNVQCKLSLMDITGENNKAQDALPKRSHDQIYKYSNNNNNNKVNSGRFSIILTPLSRQSE